MVRIKICGVTNLEDALLAERLGADALGFIFTKKSPRYIKPEKAKKIISFLGPFVSKIGVFMDQEKKQVLEIASLLNLDALQFHGKESYAYCNYFRCRFKVIKVCFPSDEPKIVFNYEKLDALMFDIPYLQKTKGKKSLPSGSLAFIKKKIKEDKKIIISGGLNCNNIKNIKKLKPYGVDVCSGIEKLVGEKDKNLIEDFIGKVKNDCS